VVDAQHDGKERAHKVSVAIRHPRRLLAIGPRVQPEILHAALLRGLDDRAERGGVERESVMLARDATVRDDGEFAQRAPLAIRAAPQEAVSLPELGHDASSGVRISFGSPQRRGEAAHVHAESDQSGTEWRVSPATLTVMAERVGRSGESHQRRCSHGGESGTTWRVSPATLQSWRREWDDVAMALAEGGWHLNWLTGDWAGR